MPVRFPIVSALLLSVLTVERQALSYDTWFQAELYRRCIEQGINGHNLERAVTVLSALVLRRPEEADHQMTLGCAYVSHLTSLHCATKDAKVVDSAREISRLRKKPGI
jgi:hypothetical protein